MELFDLVLPGPTGLEAAILGAAALVLLLGIPVVMATVRLPSRLELREVGDDELTPRQRAWFEAIESRLRAEGYRRAMTFQAINLPGTNLNRAFMSDAFPAMGLATLVKSENEDVVNAASYLEFVTEFADGTGVTTRGAAADDLFEPLPGSEIHVHRYTRDPVELKQKHEAHCAVRQLKQPVFHRHDEFGSVIRAYHERWIAQQAAVGLVAASDAQTFRPTLKLAARGVRSFFNPFEESFDLWKFLAVLLGGFALPLVANLALVDARVPVAALVESQLQLGAAASLAVAMAPVMLLAGAFVGWVFPNNTFVWPSLCAWASSRLLLPEVSGDWLATGIWMSALIGVPVAAQHASKLKHRVKGLL